MNSDLVLRKSQEISTVIVSILQIKVIEHIGGFKSAGDEASCQLLAHLVVGFSLDAAPFCLQHFVEHLGILLLCDTSHRLVDVSGADALGAQLLCRLDAPPTVVEGLVVHKGAGISALVDVNFLNEAVNQHFGFFG